MYVMKTSVSVSKKLIVFFKLLRCSVSDLLMKRILKKCFLVTNVCAGSETLCRGQHVARELRVEWA
jgi:hypothetical protein